MVSSRFHKQITMDQVYFQKASGKIRCRNNEESRQLQINEGKDTKNSKKQDKEEVVNFDSEQVIEAEHRSQNNT